MHTNSRCIITFGRPNIASFSRLLLWVPVDTVLGAGDFSDLVVALVTGA